MKTVLATRPEHDDTTHYLSAWCGPALEDAEKKGFKTIDLHRDRANREEFEATSEKLSPKLVILNGHGSDDVVRGHDDEPLLIADDNENLTDAKIIYTISCSSAKTLGPKSIDAGAVSYIGFTDDFTFYYDTAMVSRPLKDRTARLFLEPPQLFVKSLVKGNTVESAKEKTEKVMRKNLSQALSGVQDPSVARYLWWNLRNFTALGDTDAKV